MIIVHENLPREAERVAESFGKVFGFDSRILDRSLEDVFEEIPEFGGFFSSSCQLKGALDECNEKKVLVLTHRDIYANNTSKNDDWIFGYCSGNLTLASTARMKRFDSQPSSVLEVPEELYFRRLETLAIHEIGHGVVRAPHLQLATWVNAQSGGELWLGMHCTDNTCVMYEVVDIRAPPASEGHLRLGTEKRYDAGLDDVLERLNPNWFCDRCRNSIEIDERYSI